MNLYDLDYLSVTGHSWLHRLPAWSKLVGLACIIALLLSIYALPLYIAIFLGVMVLAVSARLPLRPLLTLTLYPLVFLIIIFISIEHLTFPVVLLLTLRVLAITASVVLMLLTTSYPAIFGTLGRVLPGALVAALFFTYRALFILSTSLVNARTAFHLRGGLSWRHPFLSVRNLGTALAHVLVHAIEMSQRMAESLTVRGFQNRIYYLGRKR